MKNFVSLFALIITSIPLLISQEISISILNGNSIYCNATLAQDYDNDGDMDIIALGESPGQLVWFENEPTKQFPLHTIIDTIDFKPTDVDFADLDNDGDQDYVICGRPIGSNPGELAVFEKQNDATYIKHTIVDSLGFDNAELGDFNGDGFIDIVAVGFFQITVNVYLNDGNWNFTEQVVAPELNNGASGGQVQQVDAEDVDNDGDIDIAFGDGNSNGRLYLNDGNANFTFGYTLNGWSDGSASIGREELKIIDLDNNGSLDILSFTIQGLGGLYFLDGSNSFDQSLIDREGVDLGGAITVADFDDNGLLDIARQHIGLDYISVLYQMDTLQFTTEYIDSSWDNQVEGTQMDVLDIDGDGDLDLVVPQKRVIDWDISWFENINGHLYRHYIVAELKGARTPQLNDFDGDGDLDIFLNVASANPNILTDDEILLFENVGETFVNWRLNETITSSSAIELADIDNDGDADAIVTSRDANNILFLHNDGFQANWVTDTIVENINTPVGLAINDMNGDTYLDLVVCSSEENQIVLFVNDGNLEFTPQIIDLEILEPLKVKIADFNNDTDFDVVAISSNIENTIAVYLADGTSYNEEIVYTGKQARDLEIVDWDNDNDMDIIVSFFSASSNIENPVDLLLLTNDGNGNFVSSELLSIEEKTNGISLGDMDNDGDLDIVYSYDYEFSTNPSLINIAINNNGEINDLISLTETEGGLVHGIVVGDIDNDDLQEIVYADLSRDNLVYINFTDTTITDTTSTDQISETIRTLTLDIQISPNPTVDQIRITNDNQKITIKSVSIKNSIGAEMFFHTVRKEEELIYNFDQYSTGIYYIVIETNYGLLTKKIVKS